MMDWLSSLYAEHKDQIEMLVRLCVATVSGMAIGLNRDLHDKPIGMRTLGLVSLSSALVVLSGSAYGDLFYAQDAVSRVVQGILTG
jgi:putative Mg2+ transporter-C (MgtC) family protein